MRKGMEMHCMRVIVQIVITWKHLVGKYLTNYVSRMYFLCLISRIHLRGFIVADRAQLCAVLIVNFSACMGNSRKIGTGAT